LEICQTYNNEIYLIYNNFKYDLNNLPTNLEEIIDYDIISLNNEIYIVRDKNYERLYNL
jgi:hypothetical protein